jgi:glutamine amidotransferase
MCLLTLLLPGADVDRDEYRTAAIANPDGFGWAVHTGRGVVRLRTMNYRDAVDSFEQARAHWPRGVAMFHWRWATGGRVDRTMAHPFRWGDDERIAIGHNGVLPIEPTATDSDTALLAKYLGGAGAHVLDDRGWIEDLAHFAAGSKLVFLSAHPDTREDHYIVNEDAGHWRGGAWFSNTSYLPWEPPKRTYLAPTVARGKYPQAPTGWDDPDPWGDDYRSTPPRVTEWDYIGCAVCGHDFPVPYESLAAYCDACGACWLCDSEPAACRCHVAGRR